MVGPAWCGHRGPCRPPAGPRRGTAPVWPALNSGPVPSLRVSYLTPPGVVLVSTLGGGRGLGVLDDLGGLGRGRASAGAAISPWAWAGSSSGGLAGNRDPRRRDLHDIRGRVAPEEQPSPSTRPGRIRISFRAIPLRFDLIRHSPIDIVGARSRTDEEDDGRGRPRQLPPPRDGNLAAGAAPRHVRPECSIMTCPAARRPDLHHDGREARGLAGLRPAEHPLQRDEQEGLTPTSLEASQEFLVELIAGLLKPPPARHLRRSPGTAAIARRAGPWTGGRSPADASR